MKSAVNINLNVAKSNYFIKFKKQTVKSGWPHDCSIDNIPQKLVISSILNLISKYICGEL